MSTPERRHFTPAAKVAILRKHLLEAQPVSEVCSEAGIAVSQFYQWQKTFFEQGAAAFETAELLEHALDGDRVASDSAPNPGLAPAGLRDADDRAVLLDIQTRIA